MAKQLKERSASFKICTLCKCLLQSIVVGSKKVIFGFQFLKLLGSKNKLFCLKKKGSFFFRETSLRGVDKWEIHYHAIFFSSNQFRVKFCSEKLISRNFSSEALENDFFFVEPMNTYFIVTWFHERNVMSREIGLLRLIYDLIWRNIHQNNCAYCILFCNIMAMTSSLYPRYSFIWAIFT